MNLHRSLFLALSAALILIGEAAAQEWTRFRGPNGTGVSEVKGIPVTWTEKDYRWRVELPGESHSQPVIWGDKIFMESSAGQGKERMLVCLKKEDGKELWVKKYPMPTPPPGNKNSGYANSSPVADKDRVIACFASTEQFLVKAWDHAGKEIWTVNLGPFKSQHGLGTSPIIYDDRVIVCNDQDGDSFVVALDVKTGKVIWKCARKGAEQNTAYGTPCVIQRKGFGPEILTSSFAHGISSIDEKTGVMLWEAKIFDKRAVASPVVVGDLVFGSCGQGDGGSVMGAVRLGGKGDVTASHLAYKIQGAIPYVPTPVAFGERLYVLADGGFLTCLEPASGRIVWKERIGGKYFASPIVVDGRIYCLSVAGEMVVIATGDEFKVLGRSPAGEGSHSTPCVDGERIYVKTFTHLVCLGGK